MTVAFANYMIGMTTSTSDDAIENNFWTLQSHETKHFTLDSQFNFTWQWSWQWLQVVKHNPTRLHVATFLRNYVNKFRNRVELNYLPKATNFYCINRLKNLKKIIIVILTECKSRSNGFEKTITQLSLHL